MLLKLSKLLIVLVLVLPVLKAMLLKPFKLPIVLVLVLPALKETSTLLNRLLMVWPTKVLLRQELQLSMVVVLQPVALALTA